MNDESRLDDGLVRVSETANRDDRRGDGGTTLGGKPAREFFGATEVCDIGVAAGEYIAPGRWPISAPIWAVEDPCKSSVLDTADHEGWIGAVGKGVPVDQGQRLITECRGTWTWVSA